jgi:hypothetical protein
MKRLLLVPILITAACSFLALSQTPGVDTKTKASPLAGTWKANLAKSQRDPNHQFQSLTLRFEVSDDTVSLIYSGVNMSGEEESGTTKLHPDGKQYPVAEAPGVVVTTKWVGSRILDMVAKKDEKVVGQGTYEVSSDGKTLTARIKGIDASGGSAEQVVVLERQ